MAKILCFHCPLLEVRKSVIESWAVGPFCNVDKTGYCIHASSPLYLTNTNLLLYVSTVSRQQASNAATGQTNTWIDRQTLNYLGPMRVESPTSARWESGIVQYLRRKNTLELLPFMKSLYKSPPTVISSYTMKQLAPNFHLSVTNATGERL